jgi:hypothetical protein
MEMQAFNLKFNNNIALLLGVRTMAFNTTTIFRLYRGGQFYYGENHRTRKKPPTCHKSLNKLLSHNVASSTPRHERDLNLQL